MYSLGDEGCGAGEVERENAARATMRGFGYRLNEVHRMQLHLVARFRH